MDSRVVPSQVHDDENNENLPHVGSEQVTHVADEQHPDNEKKSVLDKVKAKARKIKDSIKKHGYHGHEHNNEDQHIEDKAIVEDPQVQGVPDYENEGFKSATPASEQVENFGKSGSDFGSTTVMAAESPRQDPLVVGVSSTTEKNQNIATEQAQTFAEEEKPEQSKVDLVKPIVLEDDPHAQGSRPEAEAYTLPNYQTKVTDPSGEGSDEIEDITTVEESFERLNVHDEPKPTTEPRVLPEIADTVYPPTGSNDQVVPQLSAATETQDHSARNHDQFSSEKISTNINRNPEIEEQTFNTIATTPEEQQSVKTQSNQNSYTDEIPIATADNITVSSKNSEASEIGYDEEGDRNDKVTTTNQEQQKTEDVSDSSESTAEYGKNIDQSLTEKLAPVYGKVAEVGSTVKSKVYGTSTGGVGTETETTGSGVEDQNQNKGVALKDYLAEKLRPGEEDKALSEVISEAYKGKEEEVKKEQGQLGSGDEKSEKVHEESYVNKVKGVVGSWFTKSGDNQSPQGAVAEELSNDKISGVEKEHVSQVVDERKTDE